MKQFWTIVKDYMRRQKRLFVVSLVLYLITALLAMLPAKILQLTIDVGFMRSDVQAFGEDVEKDIYISSMRKLWAFSAVYFMSTST